MILNDTHKSVLTCNGCLRNLVWRLNYLESEIHRASVFRKLDGDHQPIVIFDHTRNPIENRDGPMVIHVDRSLQWKSISDFHQN